MPKLLRILTRPAAVAAGVMLAAVMAFTPAMMLCACDAGHQAIAFVGHQQPACQAFSDGCRHDHGDDDNAPTSPDSQPSPTDEQPCTDAPLRSDVLIAPDGPQVVHLATPLIAVIETETLNLTALHHVHPFAEADVGPPADITSIISSTVLLI